ncbi:MAG: histidine kinase [Actinomycetota bacterium]
MSLSKRDRLFFIFFGLAFASAVGWLLLGLLPTIAAADPEVHRALHRWGATNGVLAQLAGNAAQASHGTGAMWQAVLDFGFSAVNLVLSIFVLRLRPRDFTARLLALGMVGVAVTFNLRGHDALQVVPVSWLGEIDVWHVLVHILSGLAYLFALLLFPDGRFVSQSPTIRAVRVPVMMIVTLIFTMLSLFTTDDHTLGLVLVFGILVPVAAVVAQFGRLRAASDPETRQQSRVLMWALVVALGTALPLMFLTTSRDQNPGEQRTNEIPPLGPGEYFFRCDPHPQKMVGSLLVTEEPGAPISIGVTALKNRFDTRRIVLASDRRTTIELTNLDADLHNMAVYRDEAALDPVFIGAKFSGVSSAAFSFRLFRLVFAVIPIALIVGLVRFRLWDIDRIVNRTLVYGIVVGVITLAYLALVVGLGTLVGAGTQIDVALSVVLTALIAVIFQPLRERARTLANRLIYGRRATPYEVLSRFSDRVSETYAVDDVLPTMARTIGEATSAARVEVWLRVGDKLVCSAAFPEVETRSSAKLLDGNELPSFGDSGRAVAVTHSGELLGAISVTKPPGEELTPIEERLLGGIASQAGLMLRNVQLGAELNARIGELRASRKRIVSAQDAERRRIERDIHDGAQQNLVALGMKLRMAHDLASRDPAGSQHLMEEIQRDTSDALQTLRDLARGIYPPILSDKGIVPALKAYARRCPVTVAVQGASVGRYSREVENAVYFCCLEAIQNAVKHADGPIGVTVWQQDTHLRFEVADGGPGFTATGHAEGSGLQNMTDRVAALGGNLEIVSRPGATTLVRGSVPASPAPSKIEV